jgi:DNA repair exonuclease SbcCD nuclease subunit
MLCHTPRQFKRDFDNALADIMMASINIPYKHTVVIMHETIKGSISDTNWRIKGGAEVPLLEYGEEIKDNTVTYLAIGDLHVKQRLAPRTYYSGAPLQIKFGDQWPKGILVVDTEDPDNPIFEPIKSKQLVRVTSMENIPKDCHVKLVTDKISALGAALPENVMKLEYAKAEMTDSLLDLSKNLSLHQLILEGITKSLDGQDLVIAKREVDEMIQQIQQADS